MDTAAVLGNVMTDRLLPAGTTRFLPFGLLRR